MNKEIYEIIKNNHLHIKEIKKIGKVYIIKDEKRTYVIKLNTSNYDIYKYLLSRNFLYYPENLNNKNDNYDFYLYIEDIITKRNQRIEDLLEVLSILHFKTSYIREIDLDEIKKIYEDINDRIIKTKDYYLNLNDNIDNNMFLSPDHYLLVRNISLIYYMIEYTNKVLNIWYIKIKEEKKIRVSLLHNNISINHLIINDNKYLISWDKSYFDSPIYDIDNFYRNYFSDIKLSDMFNIYNKKNKLNSLEKDFLLIKLSLPKIIDLGNNTFLNCENIYKEISYLKEINEYILNEIKIKE